MSTGVSSTRRLSNRALKPDAVSSLIQMKQEVGGTSTPEKLRYSGNNNSKLSGSASSGGGVNKTDPKYSGLQQNKPTESPYAARKITRVSPSVGPTINDIAAYQSHLQNASHQQQLHQTPSLQHQHQNQLQSTAVAQQHQPTAVSAINSGSSIISNSGYNIVTSTANMIRRNSFGLLKPSNPSAAANNENSTSISINHTANTNSMSGGDDSASSTINSNGTGRPAPLVKQNSTTRQMLNSMAMMLAAPAQAISNSVSGVTNANSSGSSNVTGRKPSIRQVMPIDDSKSGAATEQRPEVGGPESNSRIKSPNEETPSTIVQRRLSKSNVSGKSGSTVGITPGLASRTPSSSAVVGQQQQAPNTAANATASAGATGAVMAPNTAAVVTGKQALCCDKCDGKHKTDDCPHYQKNRESHPDAQKNFYKKLGGSSNLPGAILPHATIVRQPGDGSCLFHSLSYGLRDGSSASSLRAEICAFIAKHPTFKICDTPLSDWVKWDSNATCTEYARRMSGGAWGGGIEMACLSQLRNVNVHVYEAFGSSGSYSMSGRGSKYGSSSAPTSGFKRISAFDVPVEPEKQRIVRVLYCGGVHYEALVAP